MKGIGNGNAGRRNVWGGAVAATCVVAVVMGAGSTDLMAQYHSPDLTRLEIPGLTTEIPDFGGVWDKDRQAYPGGESSFDCGGLIGPNGFPLSQCEVPVAELMERAHPRMLAWIDFAGPTDEYFRPVMTAS